MNAVRQACRPKHQVLILRCYPKYQKNAVDVKPNSSELSYLLYYASTRRSKLQKVGDFLDKRTTSDVYYKRLGSVQVTLLILAALIEKTSRDLPLYSHAVLSILRTILKSNNVEMVEASVPAFETFCAHQDPATLAADQEYIQQYEEVLKLYAAFASKETPLQANVPVAIRVRKAGLEALKAVATSDSLSAETPRQLAIIVPIVLQNLYARSGSHLKFLEEQEHKREELEKEAAYKRRQSSSTVRTAEAHETDPAAAEGTTEDADKLAEEEVGIIALQTLRQIFAVNVRGQHRIATSTVLKFVASHVRPTEYTSGTHTATGRQEDIAGGNSWHTTLFTMLCGWAPVQDRFVILVTIVETLIRSPIVERDLEKQLTLVAIIRWLLSSSINFIGLSVMDVLVGLIQHVLLLLQLGGSGSGLAPHSQQPDGIGKERGLYAASSTSSNTSARSGREFKEAARQPVPVGSLTNGLVMEVVRAPSSSRIQLLGQLQRCIGALATHIYYTDQISDMISAILVRLKPPTSSAIPTTADAIQNPLAAVDAVADSVNLQEKPNTDGFFSFDTARLMALQSIKEIIVTANARRLDGTSNAVGRTQVGTSVWEGTQWLLRDPSGSVRKAYVDALVTWLDLEFKTPNLKIWDDGKRSKKKKENRDTTLARRAVSSASHRPNNSPKQKCTFLQLLSLAIYENALQFCESEPDILLLHLLLTTLTTRLTINAARSSLPMVLALQEAIPTPSLPSPTAKMNIGSLVHGYLWALTVTFDLEATPPGRTIHAEIARRAQHGIWLPSIRVPPAAVDEIPTPPSSSTASALVAAPLPLDVVQKEALRPFDERKQLVDRIAAAYTRMASPPGAGASPPSSPGRRSFSVPMLDLAGRARSVSAASGKAAAAAAALAKAAEEGEVELPRQVREEMMGVWDRDACVAAMARQAFFGAGAERGLGGHRHLLVQGRTGTEGSGRGSPRSEKAASRPDSPREGLSAAGASRTGGAGGGGSREAKSGSESSVRETVRIEDLKRVLASGGSIGVGAGSAMGYAMRTRRSGVRSATGSRRSARARLEEDTASESLVSAEDLDAGELDFGLPAAAAAEEKERERQVGIARANAEAQAQVQAQAQAQPTSTSPYQSPVIERTYSVADIEGLGIIPRPSIAPPVPLLPPSIQAMHFSPPPVPSSGVMNNSASPVSKSSSLRRSVKAGSQRGGGSGIARVDVNELLSAITVDEGAGGKGGVGRPPY